MSVEEWVSAMSNWGQFFYEYSEKPCGIVQNCPAGEQGDSVYPLTSISDLLRIALRRVYLSVLLGEENKNVRKTKIKY